MCSVKVHDWLVLLTMEKYWHMFVEHGYVSIAHCQQIIFSDLIMLGIENPQHRQLLLDGVQLMINSPNLFECRELCELHTTRPHQLINYFKLVDGLAPGVDKVDPNNSPALEEEPEFSQKFTKRLQPCEPKTIFIKKGNSKGHCR